MRNTAVGLVLMDLGRMKSPTAISKRVNVAKRLTPEGRILAVMFDLPTNFKPSRNIESLVTRSVLAPPLKRSDHEAWEFFGHLVIRVCEVHHSQHSIEKEMGVVLFRRQGPKAYLLRRGLNEREVAKAKIATLHPVFTRDVANNVWHLEKNSAKKDIINRLTSLLAWPGESFALVKSSSVEMRPIERMDLDSGLIGVPTKVNYGWATGQDPLDPIFED